MSEVVLEVGGVRWVGWLSMSLVYSLEALAATFELELSDRWPKTEGTPRPIEPFQACRVLLAGQTVLTGQVDSVRWNIAKDSRKISVSGRSKTAQLVDSSTEETSWKALTLVQLANRLGAKLDVSASCTTKDMASENVAAHWGETPLQVLERVARKHGLLLTTGHHGQLIITTEGKTQVPDVLELGRNVLSADLALNGQERYSSYIIHGQSRSTDALAIVSDAEVGTHRPLHLVADGVTSEGTARTRGEWERARRRGQSFRVSALVRGWRMADNNLWPVNRLVSWKDGSTTRTLLIAGVKYGLSSAGQTTTLELTRPGAFAVEPLPEPS